MYHVMARGNEQKAIFHDDTDRKIFLNALAQAREQFGLVLHAYCLMSNHYHLAAQTPRGNLSQAMGWMQTTYSVRFNRRHVRSGHLFQGRFKAHLVEADAYARSLVMYIHLNPVRPHDKQGSINPEMRDFLDGYPWSSHRVYAGLTNRKEVPAWLCLDWLWYFGHEPGTARREYRRQMDRCFVRPASDLLEAAQGGLVLGGERFWEVVKERMAGSTGREEIRWSSRANQAEQAMRVEKLLMGESDRRIEIWARVRLGGERLVNVAARYGYSDASGVHRVVERLEALALEDPSVGVKIQKLRSLMDAAELL